MGFIARSMERRVTTFNWPMTTPWGAPDSTGMTVNRESSIGLSTVWACIRLLTGAVSRMPVDVRIDRDGVTLPYAEPRWLRRPILTNPNFDRITHFSQVMASLVIDGNFYVLTVRDDSNDVSELFVLDPERVEITGSLTSPGYRVQYEKGHIEYGPNEVLHRPLLSLPGTVDRRQPARSSPAGHRPRPRCSGVRGAVLWSVGSPGWLYQDGGRVHHHGHRVRDNWDGHHSGVRNSHRTGVLVGAEWKSIQPTHEQMEFVALRGFQVGEVARWYGVPPHMVGDVERSTSWGSGIEQQGIGFTVYTLNDYLALLESAYGSIVPNPNSYVVFNRNALMRGDSKSRVDFYRGMWEMGAMNPDEIRAKEDLPPRPDGSGEEFKASGPTVGSLPAAADEEESVD